MIENEFLILDELYFVISFDELEKSVNLEDILLKNTLKDLIEKGWVKIYSKDKTEEIEYVTEEFDSNFHTYSYLATKKGLLVHNSN